jgi:hypothetical protein
LRRVDLLTRGDSSTLTLVPERFRSGPEAELLALVSADRGGRRVSLEAALALVNQTWGVDLSRAKARAGFSRGHLLDVVVSLPGGRGDARELEAARQLLTLVLGEARVSDWLGELGVVPAPRGGPLAVVQSQASGEENFFPLSELRAAFEAAITGLYLGLPELPLCEVGGEQRWTLLELEVERAADYAAQDDAVLASTFMPEMLKCFLSGSSFASCRFSRHGELFAYLKFRQRPRDLRAGLAARRVLEDAIDAALVTERAGRVVGSGLGVLYAYVNFALSDLERGVTAVRSVGRRVGLPEQSWILFCDNALEAEWVGLRPGAVPPPGT